MKKKALKYVFNVVLSVTVIICLCVYLYIQYKNKSNKNTFLSQANNIICENIVNYDENNNNGHMQNLYNEKEIFSNAKILECNNILGKIKIPKLNIEAPIKEGTTADILKQSVGHFSKTNYWYGNVALASHNRGTYAHYFEKINTLNIKDEIIYQTKLGTRIYEVSEINQISENDMSVLNSNEKNVITLITCIKNKANFRLCIKAEEKIC